ncbi:CPBP family intramembrane glutamic endopeptidase [Maricaulis sp. CAU 1757]
MDLTPLTSQPSLIAGLIILLALLAYTGWEEIQRRRTGVTDPRLVTYARTAALLWVTTGAVLVCWMWAGLSLQQLGLAMPTGTGALIGWGLAALALAYALYSLVQVSRSQKSRAQLRQQFDESSGLALIRPETGPEKVAFQGLSVTAGITEEIIFRGFLIMSLALVMPLWAAALVSVIAFVAAHAYQGLSGMARIVPVTVLMTVIVVASGSLWPAILVHILADSSAGLMAHILDRTADSDAAATPA